MSDIQNNKKGTEETTQQQPNYLTKEEFGKTAAFLRKLSEENESLRSMVSAIVEKTEDGGFRLKGIQPEAPAKPEKSDPMAEVEKLRLEIKKRDELLAEEKNRAATTAKKAALIDVMSKANAVNPQRDVVHIFDMVKQNDQGEYVVTDKDENGLQVDVSINNYVSKWLSSNPELVKPSAKAGSRTPSGQAATSFGGADVTSLANMSPAEYNAHRKKNR